MQGKALNEGWLLLFSGCLLISMIINLLRLPLIGTLAVDPVLAILGSSWSRRFFRSSRPSLATSSLP
jgi:hypothetical protein